MALSLSLHDILPSTSAQPKTTSKGTVESSKFSYAEVATGKHVTKSGINSLRAECSAALFNQTVSDEVSNTSKKGWSTRDSDSESLNDEKEVLDVNNPKDASLAPVTGDEAGCSFWLSAESDELLSQFSSSVTTSQCSRDVWQAAVENMERDNIIREKIGLIINKRYRVMQKISFGSYGSIYSAFDMCTKKDVAVKFEIGSKPANELHLKYEIDVYRRMKDEPGVPTVYWFGRQYNHQILVMQLLGPSLEQLFSYCERSFDLNTVVLLADQMLLRLWSLHSRGFIHRDIKPDNFLMGTGDFENTCFLVDFGLARRFRYHDGNKLSHIPFKKGKGLVGTAKYASINSHNGLELSRRDDLESLGYIVVEFINQEVPWKSKIRFRSKQHSYNRIRSMKKQIDWKVVCPKMAEWLSYCKKLGFNEEPDYAYLRGLIQSLLSDNDISPSTHGPITVNYTPLPGFSANRQNKNSSACNFDDGTKRYSWLMKRDSSPSERYTFECLFHWTLPSNHGVVTPPHLKNNEKAFRYGGHLNRYLH